jgi:predicted nucleic acid binding AN1-type Zn finger protein
MLCHTCVKKVTLLEQTTCKCNKCSQYYCTKHRLMEAHACAYDSKVKKKEEIEQYIVANKCVNDKMIRI